MTFRSALLAATLLAAPIAAQAQQPISGLYIGAGLGANFMQDEKLSSSYATPLPGGASFASGRVKWNAGFVGLGSIGWGFGNGLRVEVEGSYRDNAVDRIKGGTFAVPYAGGSERKGGVMGNVLYDFAFVPYVTPYIGAGGGYQWVNWANVRGFDGFGNETRYSHTEGSAAVQGIAGLALPIPALPGLSLTVEYRFLALLEDRTYPGSLTTFNGIAGPGGTRVGSLGIPAGQYEARGKASDDYNHSILLGVRYAFNAAVPPPPPAPAPAAAPAPAPSRSYLVFFDWDRADLTGRARQIIREAAENSTRVQYTRIEVNGYTDTSGTPQYNQRLSIRRAESVAAELVRDGVPRNAINIQGFGETHLLVPTGPGVREPQNRRVEIIIR